MTLGDILAFLISSPTDFYETSQVTDADEVMNPQHFGRYLTHNILADIWIWIQINPEIRM